MKIFFSASTRNILKHKDAYREIVKTVKNTGYSMTRDWLERAIKAEEEGQKTLPRPKLYKHVMNSINDADLVIFDVTEGGMSIAHQIAFALEKNKPTLVIMEGNKSDLSSLFISGSDYSNLTLADYESIPKLRDVVSLFISKQGNQQKRRFNLVLANDQLGYLDWAAYRYGITKTDIIKQLITKGIEDDKEYDEYLSNQI